MSMLGLESLNARTPVVAQNYATIFILSELSNASAISDEALNAADAAASGIEAICNIYDVANVCKKFGCVTKSVEALVGKELVSLEYKDQRTLWEKIKEFFIRLWHSIQDWFAKFNFAIDRCLKALNAINTADYKSADYEKVKDVKLLPDSYYDKYMEILNKSINKDTNEITPLTLQKLSESSKQMHDALKELRAEAKTQENVPIKSDADVKNLRDVYINLLNNIKKRKAAIVLFFENTAQRIKAGRGIGDDGSDTEGTDTSAYIRALKDQRHALMSLTVACGKSLVKDGWKFVNACKKIKEKKADK